MNRKTPERVQAAGYLIWHLSTKWRVAVDRALNSFGLMDGHYLVLGSLYEFSTSGAPPSQRELADFSGLEVEYVSKLIRDLERDGLLYRTDHRDAARPFTLKATVRGAGLAEHAAVVIRNCWTSYCDQLVDTPASDTWH